jgi:hypothetical protein
VKTAARADIELKAGQVAVALNASNTADRPVH